MWILLVALAALIVATVLNPEWTPADVLGAIPVSLLALVPLVKPRARRSDARRLLRPADESWSRLHAAVAECDWGHELCPGVTGWAVLPGGEPAVFRIDDCPLDLYTDIYFRRSLWLLGTADNEVYTVGIPDFPVLARATIAARSSARATGE